MKVEQRDDLLIRIDERVKALPNIEKHLKELNAQVSKNTSFRKVGTGVGYVLLVALIGLFVKLFTG